MCVATTVPMLTGSYDSAGGGLCALTSWLQLTPLHGATSRLDYRCPTTLRRHQRTRSVFIDLHLEITGLSGYAFRSCGRTLHELHGCSMYSEGT